MDGRDTERGNLKEDMCRSLETKTPRAEVVRENSICVSRYEQQTSPTPDVCQVFGRYYMELFGSNLNLASHQATNSRSPNIVPSTRSSFQVNIGNTPISSSISSDFDGLTYSMIMDRHRKKRRPSNYQDSTRVINKPKSQNYLIDTLKSRVGNENIASLSSADTSVSNTIYNTPWSNGSQAFHHSNLISIPYSIGWSDNYINSSDKTSKVRISSEESTTDGPGPYSEMLLEAKCKERKKLEAIIAEKKRKASDRKEKQLLKTIEKLDSIKRKKEMNRARSNPETSKVRPWTKLEDSELLRLHRIHGNRWKRISDALPGRSCNSTRFRCSVLCSQLKQYDEHPPPSQQSHNLFPLIAKRRMYPLVFRWNSQISITPKKRKFQDDRDTDRCLVCSSVISAKQNTYIQKLCHKCFNESNEIFKPKYIGCCFYPLNEEGSLDDENSLLYFAYGRNERHFSDDSDFPLEDMINADILAGELDTSSKSKEKSNKILRVRGTCSICSLFGDESKLLTSDNSAYHTYCYPDRVHQIL